MTDLNFIRDLFSVDISIKDNLISFKNITEDIESNQKQTKDIFSDKWASTNKMDEVNKLYNSQFDWFLQLYGMGTIENLRLYLKDKKVIIDTGCGLGYKAAWLSELAPQALVIGIDISEAARIAAENYKGNDRLWFLQADIADTHLKPGSCDLVVCDQVIMHTERPEKTFAHLSSLTSKAGEFLCYFYRKKALPRELIDDYFRSRTHEISNDDMWKFSEQLTELGKRLSNLNVKINSPDIPLLGIKGGEYDIQRFIYWNFLKCFWKEDWGFDLSKITNYDWYAPSNAMRFSKEEVMELIKKNHMKCNFFHEEEACYAGRFGH